MTSVNLTNSPPLSRNSERNYRKHFAVVFPHIFEPLVLGTFTDYIKRILASQWLLHALVYFILFCPCWHISECIVPPASTTGSLVAASNLFPLSPYVHLHARVMSGWQAAVLQQKRYRSLIRKVSGADNLCFLKSLFEWMDRKKVIFGICEVRDREKANKGLESLGKWSWQVVLITIGKTGGRVKYIIYVYVMRCSLKVSLVRDLPARHPNLDICMFKWNDMKCQILRI